LEQKGWKRHNEVVPDKLMLESVRKECNSSEITSKEKVAFGRYKTTRAVNPPRKRYMFNPGIA